MRLPFLMLFASLFFAGALAVVDGPVLSLPMLIAVLSALAATCLVVVTAPGKARPLIVVDGSNVMFWEEDVPSLDTVKAVVDDIRGQGAMPVVWFDANVGYRVDDRYMGPAALSRRLGIPAKYVFVAPKGTPADPLLLRDATRLKVPVVTNDRFRDWAGDYPEVTEPGHLIRGGYREGALWLDDEAPGAK